MPISGDMTLQQLISVLQQFDLQNRAEIIKSQVQDHEAPYGFEIDLSTARSPEGGGDSAPIPIPQPFKLLRFFNGDNDAQVKIITDDLTTGKNFDVLKNNGRIVADAGQMFSKAWLYNDAQPGKKINFRAYRNQAVDSGSLVLDSTAKILNPSAGTITNPTALATTAKKVLNSNDARFQATFFNNSAASVFLGFGNTVTDSGSTKGIEILPGASYPIKNTAEMWIYSVPALSAGDLTILEE